MREGGLKISHHVDPSGVDASVPATADGLTAKLRPGEDVDGSVDDAHDGIGVKPAVSKCRIYLSKGDVTRMISFEGITHVYR